MAGLISVACCVFLVACQRAAPNLEAYLTHQPAWEQEGATIAGALIVVLQRPGIGPLRVYLEGDGNAFTARGRPSLSPTPQTPVGLQLALADSSGQPLIYLGRPCQWVAPNKACGPEVFTTQRFTQAVLDDYTTLIARLSANNPTELVGFSGGAYLAYAVAQNLAQVRQVITVAGNLNPNLVNRYHRVPEMTVGTVTPRTEPLALTMLWGSRDAIIPAALVSTMATQTPAHCRSSQVVRNATHVKGWSEWWATHSAGLGQPCF